MWKNLRFNITSIARTSLIAIQHLLKWKDFFSWKICYCVEKYAIVFVFKKHLKWGLQCVPLCCTVGSFHFYFACCILCIISRSCVLSSLHVFCVLLPDQVRLIRTQLVIRKMLPVTQLRFRHMGRFSVYTSHVSL